MSDYLNNLLARARNLAPVVQPRPASLFEPSGVAASTLARPAFETENVSDALHQTAEASHEIAPPASPQANNPASTHPQATVISPAPLPTGKQSDEGVRLESRNDSVSSHTKSSSEIAPASSTIMAVQSSGSSEAGTRPLTSQRALSDLPRLPQPSPAATERTASAPVTESRNDESWSRLEPKVRQVLGEQLSALRPLRAHERDEVRRQTTSTQKAPAPDALSPAQEENRTQQQAQAFDGQHETAEPLPSINVSIGRVEVRAVISQPSARPAPRPVQQPSAPSLDDYLKQRSGGRL